MFPRLHGLHWLCVNLSSISPLLLVVDDAQWADQASLDFLAYITPRVGELGLLLAIGIRRAETEAGDALSENLLREEVRALEPPPLSQAAVARLLSRRIGEEAGRDLAPECARATGGNPLFVRELIREIARHGETGADPAEIVGQAPASVRRIVVDRVRAMPEQDGQVIRALAILGDGADSGLVQRLSGVETGGVAESVDRLIATGLLDDERLLGFEHPIVRQAIRESIPPAARSRSHFDAARALSGKPGMSEHAAAHLLEADPLIEPAGEAEVDALFNAAHRASGRGSVDTAMAFLNRALVEDLDTAHRRRALLELGTAELRTGTEGALQHLGEADEISPDGPERAEAALALSTAQLQFGAPEEAITTCDTALGLVGDHRELTLALEGQRAHTRWLAGGLSDQERERLHALEADASAGSTPAERGVLAILATEGGVGVGRSGTEVSDLADRALADGRLIASIGAEQPTYIAVGAAKTLAYDLREAIEIWSAGIEDSRRNGSLYGYAGALFSRSYAKHLAGDVPGAEADDAEAAALLPESDLFTAPLRLATAANVATERGDLGEDDEQALERLMLPGQSPPTGTVNYATLAFGRLAFSRGNLDQALERFAETGRRAEAIGWIGPSSLPWRSGAALALRGLNRPQEALVMANAEVDLARAFGATAPLGIALRTKALVVGGDEGEGLAREAVAALADSEARLEHAKALIDLGVVLRRNGAPKDSREPLREGMDRAHRCGSDNAVERAMRELRASGARPRRPARRGADSLSPQERQTTRHAADGLSNREIAEAMFLTRRTIEMHLSGAYRKLGISSREELAGRLPVN